MGDLKDTLKWIEGMLEQEPVACSACGEALVPQENPENRPVFCRPCWRQNRLEKRLDEIARLLASIVEKL